MPVVCEKTTMGFSFLKEYWVKVIKSIDKKIFLIDCWIFGRFPCRSSYSFMCFPRVAKAVTMLIISELDNSGYSDLRCSAFQNRFFEMLAENKKMMT